jgi:hypothetical protein
MKLLPILATGIARRGLPVGGVADAVNQDLLRRMSELPAPPKGWRDYFRERLWEADA